MKRKGLTYFLLRMIFGLIVIIAISLFISDKVSRLFGTRDFGEFERFQTKLQSLIANEYLELDSMALSLRKDTAIYAFPRGSVAIYPPWRDNSGISLTTIIRPDTCTLGQACLCMCVLPSMENMEIQCDRGRCQVYEDIDFLEAEVRGQPQGGFILERFVMFTDVLGAPGDRTPPRSRTVYLEKVTRGNNTYVVACFEPPCISVERKKALV